MKYNLLKDREKRVKQLIKRGHATGNEMLVAQFGEMPNGLDQKVPLDDVMTFHGVLADKGKGRLGSLFGYGHIQPGEEEKRIYINRFMNSMPGRIVGLFAGRMALARLHDVVEGGLDFLSPEAGLVGSGVGLGFTVATLFSSFRFAMASSIVKALKPSLANTAAHEFIHTLEHKGDEPLWTINNAFRANAEDIMRNDPNKWSNFWRNVDAGITMMPVGHYQQDSEILARMFLMAVRGYERYGRIAESPEETWVFMNDLGAQSTPAARVHFALEYLEPVREVFSKHGYAGLGFPPTAEINIGINAFRREAVLDMYVHDAFPVMMAGLHHILGDTDAYAKFGYDQYNPDMKGVPRPFRPEADYHEAPAEAGPDVK